MVQSAAMNVTGDVRWQWTERGTRHVMYAFFAIVAYFLVGNIDYGLLLRRTAPMWKRPILWMLLLTGIACFLVLIPHIGIEKNGARRWLPLGITQVQPSELAKWAVVLF